MEFSTEEFERLIHHFDVLYNWASEENEKAIQQGHKWDNSPDNLRYIFGEILNVSFSAKHDLIRLHKAWLLLDEYETSKQLKQLNTEDDD